MQVVQDQPEMRILLLTCCLPTGSLKKPPHLSVMHGIKKAPETLGFRGSESFWTVETFSAVLSLAEFHYLFEDR